MKILDIINKLLFYGFFALFLVFLFFDTEYGIVTGYAIGSFIVVWICSIIFKAGNINKNLLILISISFWLNIIGEFIFYYTKIIPYYDKSLHILVPIFLTIIVLDYFKSNSIKTSKSIIFFIILGMLAFWEIYEYLMFIFFSIPLQGVYINKIEVVSRIDDTMIDLIFGVVGTLGYLIFQKEFPKIIHSKNKK